MSCPEEHEIAALVADDDEEFKRHRAGCVRCRREADAIDKTLSALAQLGGSIPAGDDLFVAAVRRGYEQSAARRARGRWRLPALTVALAAAAALVALVQPRSIVPGTRAAPVHVERAADDDEDPCELIGDLDHDELILVQAKYGKGA